MKVHTNLFWQSFQIIRYRKKNILTLVKLAKIKLLLLLLSIYILFCLKGLIDLFSSDHSVADKFIKEPIKSQVTSKLKEFVRF
jgi:hypothetical protein